MVQIPCLTFDQPHPIPADKNIIKAREEKGESEMHNYVHSDVQ